MLQLSQHRLLIILLSVLLLPYNALTQTHISIHGSGKLFPIALPQLCLSQGNTTAAQDIPKVMARNLLLSGYFEVLEAGTYLEAPGKCTTQEGFAYSDWSIVGAEGLVKGNVQYDGVNLRVQLFLHDVARQKVVFGKEYEGDIGQISRIAHKFSNEIMRFFTGEYGIFGTQIAFSSKVGRFKELFLMDMDGSNLRQVTNDRALSISSSWNQLGNRLAYTSYRRRVPDIFLLDVSTKQIQQVSYGDSLELGAKFTRDGQKILLSLTSGRDSDIVIMGLDGKVLERLTPPNGAIDVSPVWSPDQSQIAFCSNRGGGPQIYVMDAQGRGARRVSFVSANYCTSPAWSPKGDRIAFVCRADGGFQIFTAKPDGSDALQLTSYGDNEDPDWSPDGRYLVFATTFGKSHVTSLALMRSDGSNVQQLTTSRIGDSEPAWSPLTE